MKTFLSVLAVVLGELIAPVVTLVYRKGWFNTPDDPVSPHGLAHGEMEKIWVQWGTWLSDWWWLGVRNKAYGLAYALKPQWFKDLTSYPAITLEIDVRQTKWMRTITIHGYKEYCILLGFCHILYGYRLRPIVGGTMDGAPYRPINMDARPIFSIRMGKEDI